MEWSSKRVTLFVLVCSVLGLFNFIFYSRKLPEEVKRQKYNVIKEKYDPSRTAEDQSEANWIRYASQRNCSLDTKFYQQIDNDLEVFRALRNSTHPYPITPEMLHLAKTKLEFVSIITLENDRIYIDTDMQLPGGEVHFLKQAAPYLPVGLQFVINRHDAFQLPKANNTLFPIFSACKTNLAYDIVIASLRHWYSNCHSENITLWESKIENNLTLFWRGSTTGLEWKSIEEFRTKSLRYKLVEWGLNVTEHPHDFPYQADIGFNDIVQFPNELRDEVGSMIHMRPPLYCADNQNYKYLVIVDGNSWVQRFSQFLQFESLLFYHPNYIEWYTPFLIPNQHYITIQNDFSDLDRKMRYVIEHEQEIKRMVKRTSQFALQHLRYQDMECYWFRLLQKYAELVEDIHDTSASTLVMNRSQYRRFQLLL